MATFPQLTEQAWNEGMTGYGGTAMDAQTRVAWKYACSRGVTGTPVFFVNGVPVAADAEWTVEQWVNVIDPLVKANEPNSVVSTAVESAPRMTTTITSRPWFRMNRAEADKWHCSPGENLRGCEFETMKTMCCSDTELCILERGCIADDRE